MEAPLIIFAALAFVAFLIWNRTKDTLERRRLQLEVQGKMLEKIGPGQALTEFLRTDEGKQFFEQLTTPPAEPARSKDPRARVHLLTIFGLIALFGGFFVVGAILIPNLLAADPEMPTEITVLVASPAFLLTGAGIGALIAALIMRRASRAPGALTKQGGDGTAD
jgi:hypothetical protein